LASTPCADATIGHHQLPIRVFEQYGFMLDS
jgi:hypothetical protein